MTDFDYKKFFAGKKITKQGFGILGRGFGVVKFLAECGAEVLVTDVKAESDFTAQIKELENFPNIKYILGEHRDQDFLDCDFVIAGSGVPKDNYFLNLSRKNNIPVYQESSLFVKIIKENFKNVKIIGITGTRGKTTTTFLIYEILKVKFGTERVHLGGNIQGIATLEILKNIKENDFVVMELDSWILQGFGEQKISPNISVFTNIMSDHMNYYKNDMKEYFLDKANIFLNQKKGDYLISIEKLHTQIEEYLGKNYRTDYHLENEEIFIDQNLKSKKFETKLIGEHNQILIALAERVSETLNIEKEIFDKAVENFKGAPGRLELIKQVEGVKIYNDTCATTPDATIAALNALSENLELNSKIILICGGKDKELDLQNLVSKFAELQNKNNLLEIIILSDDSTTGSKKLVEEMENYKNNFNQEIKYILAENLNIAANKAKEKLENKDVILFSPSFASFGMFKNEYDRGEQFNEIVKKVFK